MRMFLKVAAAALTLAGASLTSTGASAQYYYDQYGRLIQQRPQVYNPYVQRPAYVPPRVARKQAQQRQRFIEKYGYQYQQPQPYVYRQHPRPRVYQGPRYQGGYYGGYYGPSYSAPNSVSRGGQAQ
jgi:hypothetical protein